MSEIRLARGLGWGVVELVGVPEGRGWDDAGYGLRRKD
jgi:hypothetical protein